MSENEEKRDIKKSILVAIVGALSTIYLANPGAGVIEFLPDNAPFIGNLDEAAAATLLLSCLAYFGLDLSKIFGKADQFKGTGKEERDEKPVKGDIVG